MNKNFQIFGLMLALMMPIGLRAQVSAKSQETKKQTVEVKAEQGENSELSKLQQDVEGIKTKVNRMPNISGYVNGQYTFEDKGDGVSTFNIRRARIDIKGKLSSKAEYRVQFDLAGTPKLVDAFVKYKFCNAFGLQFGQFKVPFSLENPYSPLKLESIENSQVIASDVCKIQKTGRDIGLAAYGSFIYNKEKKFHYIDYTIGIFNGKGINAKDDNKKKDIAGRIEVHPFKAGTIGFSYYNGKLSDKIEENDTLVDRVRYGVGLKYDDGKLMARGEYIWGNTADKQSCGYYAVAGYWINKKVMPFLKYDFFQQDINNDETASTWYVAGVDYWPFNFMRLQVNYTLKSTKANTASPNSVDMSNMVGAMVSFKF